MTGTTGATAPTNTATSTSGGPYLLGGQLSLVDLHVGAWLARILAVSEGLAGNGAKGLEALQSMVAQDGGNVGPRVKAYWEALMGRPSFQEVYKDGLH